MQRMEPGALAVFALALLLAGCQQRPTSAATADEAVRIANAFREEHSPRASRDVLVTTEDRGDRWLVSYRLRGGGTGGLSFYEVEKATARILDSGSHQ